MFVGCQEQADVKQVSHEGMQVCLDTPERLSLCVSFGAISQPLVERLEAVSLTSDRTVKDIVFTAKILLTPPRRSDSAVTIVFLYETFNLYVQLWGCKSLWTHQSVMMLILVQAVGQASLSTQLGGRMDCEIIVSLLRWYDFMYKPNLNIPLSVSSRFLSYINHLKMLTTLRQGLESMYNFT